MGFKFRASVLKSTSSMSCEILRCIRGLWYFDEIRAVSQKTVKLMTIDKEKGVRDATADMTWREVI